jgi:long-chain fatty acid transport protein
MLDVVQCALSAHDALSPREPITGVGAIGPTRRDAYNRRLPVVFAFVLCLTLGATVSAQSTAQFPVQFDFLTPGARSLAVGGAFIAAADDATAAFTNSAGLAFIGRFEISFEGRFNGIKTPYLAGGRISGAMTGMGIDTVSYPIYLRDTDEHFGLAFASFIFPLGAKTTVTAYRHSVADVDNAFFSAGVFQRVPFAGTITDGGRDIPLGGWRSVRIVNYGASVGYRIHDKLAVGGGASVYTFKLASSFARYGFDSDSFSTPDTSLISATSTQEGHDAAPAANAGALWWPSPSWRLGITYRRGPRFRFDQDDRLLAIGTQLSRSGSFKVPDVFGVGVSWRAVNHPAGVLRALVDYDRVQYAQLKRDFIDFQAIASNRQSQLQIDSANEVHAGAEYRILKFRGKPLKREIVFRGGTWYDPDHTVRYVPKPAADALDTLMNATLPGGDDVLHYTFGGGVNWSRRLNINVAADLSSRAKYATISAALLFPR